MSLLGLLAATTLAQQPEPRPLFVEAYTNQLSYLPGDEVTFHVSTSAPKYSIEVARLGAQREVVLSKADLPGAEHPVPENASSHGCSWPVAHRLKIPPNWKSGYYSVTLRALDRGGPFIQRNRRTAESELFFVVRAEQPAREALQLRWDHFHAVSGRKG
jgi:hypothetical protein